MAHIPKLGTPHPVACPDCKGTGIIKLLNSVAECRCRQVAWHSSPSQAEISFPAHGNRDVVMLDWRVEGGISGQIVLRRQSPGDDVMADLPQALRGVIDEIEKHLARPRALQQP